MTTSADAMREALEAIERYAVQRGSSWAKMRAREALREALRAADAAALDGGTGEACDCSPDECLFKQGATPRGGPCRIVWPAATHPASTPATETAGAKGPACVQASPETREWVAAMTKKWPVDATPSAPLVSQGTRCETCGGSGDEAGVRCGTGTAKVPQGER